MYEHLIQHRQAYSRLLWVDYDSLKHPAITFLPPGNINELYRADYATMREQMIYEDAVSYDMLITQLKYLRARFRLKMLHADLEAIIEQAKINVAVDPKWPNTALVKVPAYYNTNIFYKAGPGNATASYLVTFTVEEGKLLFDEITITHYDDGEYKVN